MTRTDWELLAIEPYSSGAVRRYLYGGRTEAELLAVAQRRIAPMSRVEIRHAAEDVLLAEQVRQSVSG